MNTKDYKREEEKYKSFLQIISTISFVTLLFEFSRFFMNILYLDDVQKGMAITSIALLFFILVIGLVCANGLVLHIDFFDKIIAGIRSRNDIIVTILFFAFLVSNVLFIIQDGGAKNSSITNILLLCANFGFFFAQKIRIKYMALISCLIGYLLCNIVAYTSNEGIYLGKPDFSAVITTIMSILFNLIITYNVNWFIQNNSTKTNEATEK